MIVCSNLGPTIAFALGCWLLLHTPSRLGACITRFFSPSSGSSYSALSCEPVDEDGSRLVSETVNRVLLTVGLGLLVGTGLSVVVL